MKKIKIPENARYINLGCGDYFVDSNEWANYDWAPKSKAVIQANLIAQFINKGNAIEFIYMSHYLEHLPLPLAEEVLKNCFKILNKNGIIRIVVPDLENICREYVNQLDSRDDLKSRFVSIELLDQLVRKTSGGLLTKQYEAAAKNETLKKYIKKRIGHNFVENNTGQMKVSRIQKVVQNPRIIIRKINEKYTRFVIFFIPKQYKLQEISQINHGERHHWVYDFYYIKEILEKIGFSQVYKVDAGFSNQKGFPFQPLDFDQNNDIRKGEESMFIEAIKK